jgi:UDP-2,3-diacylglucosamine hydrolase
MKTVVFSDVHLDVGLENRAALLEFVTFLRGLDPAEINRIIILGDLFDFWFEYRHVIFSGYFEVLRALAELGDRGVTFHLVCGNHDFWAGRFLRDNLHFRIHPERALMDFGGRRVLLVHGDGLNKRDWGYRCYKRLARARPVIWTFRRLHPDRAMGIARWMSRKSRRTSQIRKGAEAGALRAFAAETLRRGEADVVMCGHVHAATCEEHPTPTGTGLYINTGDWMYHRSYVEWDGAEFQLVEKG